MSGYGSSQQIYLTTFRCAVILTRFHSALGIILLRSATEAKHKHQNKYQVLQPTYVNRK